MNLDIDFGNFGINEVNMKEVIKSIDFSCSRDTQVTLQVNSSRPPYGNNTVEKDVFFGTSLKNLDVVAEFSGMNNNPNGYLTPPISAKKIPPYLSLLNFDLNNMVQYLQVHFLPMVI